MPYLRQKSKMGFDAKIHYYVNLVLKIKKIFLKCKKTIKRSKILTMELNIEIINSKL